ncbi:MAG: dicarboxylate/amino acid:cation symporter [Mogibacterium sp.]|nr:dicarboxylate/amino acid:cation symporter [Mogibacterium sp.]
METDKKGKKKLSLATKVLIGLALGIIAGIALQGNPDIAKSYINPFGTLYLNAIKMIIVPMVFCSIVMGVCGLGDAKKLGRIGLKTIGIYMFTTALACTFGMIVANVTHVGRGMNLGEGAEMEINEAPSLLENLVNIIPSNPIDAMASGNMLQIIAFALFIGAGIIMVGKKAEPVAAFLDGFAEIMYKITGWIMEFTPYGVFALMTTTIATNGLDVLLPLLKFVLTCYLAFLVHLVITYCGGITVFLKKNPITFIKEAWDAIIVSFTTCSSSATLPVTMNCAKRMGVTLPVRSFTLPLGATINMDGSAIYQCVTAMFVANLFGIDLSINQQLLIIITALLASIGTAGVAGASIIMLGTVLTSVGLPIEGIAIVVGVDKLIDMPRTSMNIIGDLMCCSIVAKSEGELSHEKVALEDEEEAA